MKKILIKYHSDKIDKLTYIDGKSDWIDLRAAEEVEFKAGEFKMVNLGISMKLPEGDAALPFAVAVLVEDIADGEGGGSTAAPIAADIFTYLRDHRELVLP